MIDLWYVREESLSPAHLDAYRELLPPGEVARLERYVFARHRRQFLCARALVRTVLSRYSPEIEPAAWRFNVSEHGRPYVAAFLPQHTFNLAHSAGLVVCGVASHGALGVDVEPLSRGPMILEMQDTVFSPSEREDLLRLPREARARHAVALWTSKEAYLKARGLGFALPLQGFSVRPGGRLTFATIDDCPERWRLTHHVPIASHLVTVCAEGTDDVSTLRELVPGTAQGGMSASWKFHQRGKASDV